MLQRGKLGGSLRNARMQEAPLFQSVIKPRLVHLLVVRELQRAGAAKGREIGRASGNERVNALLLHHEIERPRLQCRKL